MGRWLAALYPQGLFVQTTTFDPAGSYPDRSNLQFYVDPTYMEIETLSPQAGLKADAELCHVVTWHLVDRPAAGADLARRIAAGARSLVER